MVCQLGCEYCCGGKISYIIHIYIDYSVNAAKEELRRMHVSSIKVHENAKVIHVTMKLNIETDLSYQQRIVIIITIHNTHCSQCLNNKDNGMTHYSDVIMSAMASQIIGVLINRLVRRKKTLKLRVTGLFEGNPSVTGDRWILLTKGQ